MNELKRLLLRHPTRSKYILLILDFFLVLVATKMFINYNNIEIAIEETINQSKQKQLELGFAQNFQLNYEKSDYAQLFLKHENNTLMPGEFIIKFQTLSKISTGDSQKIENTEHLLTDPKDAWIQFFKERINPPK